MKTRLGLSAGALFALAVFTLAPARSEAGYNFGTYQPTCNTYADGSGYCYASYAGARASSDANAYIFVDGGANTNGQQWGSFYAYLNGKNYNCSTSNQALALRFVNLSSHPNVIFIYWDANGQCLQVDSTGYSFYLN